MGFSTDNHQRGHVTAAAFHYANTLPRSSSPVMPMPPEPESLFCNTCQRNQVLLNKTLAEYLPDEDDPEYDKYTSSLDAYRRELEDRYPQVCQHCLPRVQDQIRAAGYAAKADNLRRMIDRSREHSRTVQTSRQTWTLRTLHPRRTGSRVETIRTLWSTSLGAPVWPRHSPCAEPIRDASCRHSP